MRDLANNIGAVPAIAPAVLAATTTGDPIDLAGFGSVAVVINAGAIAGDGNFTAKLQESDTTTGGDFTDVAAADLTGTLPASLAAASAVKVGYVGNKRYVRVLITKNSGTSIAAGAVIINGNPLAAPVA